MVKFIKEKGLLYALGLAVFFSLVHYKGFDRDAAIYLLQVMNYLQPERFVNDVPFMFGNQDSFSIYSPIIAVVFKVLGVNVGGIIATFLSLLAFGVALIAFTCKWSRLFNAEQWRAPIVFALFVLLADKTYGSGSFYLPIFEPYLVARVLSIILITVGLIFIFDKNRYPSLVIFVMATLMHPLMGGWALLLWLFFLFPKTRLPLLVFALISPLSGFLHIGHLDFYSDDWKPLYISPGWDELVAYSGFLIFWVFMYQHFKGSVLSKFSINLFYVSLIGFYLQFAGAYSEHLLLYQVQPFRVQWLCMIPMVPVFAFFVRDCICNEKCLTIRDYSGIALGLFAIAGSQWMELSVIAGLLWIATMLVGLFFLFNHNGSCGEIAMPQSCVKWLFSFGLFFLLVDTFVCNYIQLAVEQGVGNVGLAVVLYDVPGYMAVVRLILLVVTTLVCVCQKKYGNALIFATSFCCPSFKILPIVGLFVCAMPDIRVSIKNALLAFAMAFSFFELVNSLHRFNSTEKLPLEGDPLVCISMFIVFLILFYVALMWGKRINPLQKTLLLLVSFISLFAWDVYRWDMRSETIIVNEQQMDAFFETPIFPQIKDRGRLLFTVDYEMPKQSRINFMTGAYADESIYVGEVFYKEQFMESNRRRAALLFGDSVRTNVANFGARMMNVYLDPDTLLSRVHYLCRVGEITYFATDYANMPLPKQDSVFLDVKQKFVWLYGCSK